MHFEEWITPLLDDDVLVYFHLISEPFVYTEVIKHLNVLWSVLITVQTPQVVKTNVLSGLRCAILN